jgi:hypothetical protein
MRHRAALAALVFLVLGVVAAAASAAPPTREPAPPPPGTHVPITGVCPFDVDLLFLTNKERITTFSSGSQIVTGQLSARVTNVESGKSIDLQISGPVFTGVDSNVVTLNGRSLLYFLPGDLGAGKPGVLLLTSGPVVVTLGATSITIDSRSAAVTDLCAALAS